MYFLQHVLFRAIILFATLHAHPLLAQQITYYTDVPLYTSLVQCAKTNCDNILSPIDNCGNTSPLSFYASCACLKGGNSAALKSRLSTKVASYFACGTDAVDDVSSVQAVFSSWCNAVAPRTAQAFTTSVVASTGTT